MSKKYKGMLCIYCLASEAQDADHVISRKFFPKEMRDNLPKVPTCKACNNEKSKLEHYLTTVLPFGARHAKSHKVIKMTDGRLAKNKKLYNELMEGKTGFPSSDTRNLPTQEMTLPLKGNTIEKLYQFIVKGLAWHHWNITLDSAHVILVAFLTVEIRRIFDPMLSGDAQNKVKINLGEGIFVYEGVQDKTCSELTLWRMSLYGIEVAEDAQTQSERCSYAYIFTIPKKMPIAKKLQHLFKS